MADVQHKNLTSIHRFAYVQSTDPGNVGAFKAWIDTTSTPYILKVRNAGNSGWNLIGSETTNFGLTAAGPYAVVTFTGDMTGLQSVSLPDFTTLIGTDHVPNIDATRRSNHIGTQLASTISDLQEFVDETFHRRHVTAGNDTDWSIASNATITFDSTHIVNSILFVNAQAPNDPSAWKIVTAYVFVPAAPGGVKLAMLGGGPALNSTWFSWGIWQQYTSSGGLVSSQFGSSSTGMWNCFADTTPANYTSSTLAQDTLFVFKGACRLADAPGLPVMHLLASQNTVSSTNTVIKAGSNIMMDTAADGLFNHI
jgi:hypothetical protein